jgi:hypothetical protein
MVVQCNDGSWNHAGGLPGACSDHGGESTGQSTSTGSNPTPPPSTSTQQVPSNCTTPPGTYVVTDNSDGTSGPQVSNDQPIPCADVDGGPTCGDQSMQPGPGANETKFICPTPQETTCLAPGAYLTQSGDCVYPQQDQQQCQKAGGTWTTGEPSPGESGYCADVPHNKLGQSG